MTDTTVIDEQPQDAPAEPAAPPQDSIDDLLAEYERATAQPEPVPTSEPETTAQPDQTLDDMLRATQEQERIGELESQLNSVRNEAYWRAEQEAFDKYSSDFQKHLEENFPNVDSEFAKTHFLAMATTNPDLTRAWAYRGLTVEQRNAAAIELGRLEHLWNQVQAAPPDARKQNAIQQIEVRGQELQLMLGARGMIEGARREVLKKAAAVKPPIDPDATQVHMDVAAAMVGARGPVNIKEPAPRFGQMSDAEFRNFTRKEFGF